MPDSRRTETESGELLIFIIHETENPCRKVAIFCRNNRNNHPLIIIINKMDGCPRRAPIIRGANPGRGIMVKQLKHLTLLLLLLLFTTSGVWGNEYFLYDLEKNKILVMGDGESAFMERMDLEKNPEMMMRTNNPDRYLAVFSPRYERDKRGKIVRYLKPGQLIIVDLKTGRTEDLLELGFPPLNHTYTRDRGHFFITYRPEPDSPPELLHYDIAAMKSEKFTQLKQPVKTLEISNDQKQLYLIADSHGDAPAQMLAFNYTPLALKSALPLNNPVSLHVLGNGRAALIEVNPKASRSMLSGSVKLIDTGNNTVAEERRFKFLKSRLQWFDKEKTLILIADDNQKSRCYKINNDGFRYYEIPEDWIEAEYSPENDILYILTENNLKVIDYQNSATRTMATGSNSTPEMFHFHHLPNSKLAMIYCYENGIIKFLNTDTYQMLARVKCGRPGIKFLNAITFNVKQTETVVTTNQKANRFFILNRATNDITVFDDKFKRLGFIIPPEPPLNMYQIEKPRLQTMLVTHQKIYQIDDQNLTLKPVYQYTAPAEPKLFVEEDQRIIFMTSREMLVLDPATLAPKNTFQLYTAPDARFTKLKPGQQRYFFIEAL